jgi:ketosteroid isomerase-like protein
MASPLKSLDDLILRLAKTADSPHFSPRREQYQRIAKKVEDEYARGNMDRAAKWDERLTGWEDRVDDAMTDVEDNWSEMSQGQEIDDAATGASLPLAARYADHRHGFGFSDRGDLVANLRAVAEDGLNRYPTPRQPAEDEILDLAKQIFEDRQALRDRYRQPPTMRVITSDELIRRLGPP